MKKKPFPQPRRRSVLRPTSRNAPPEVLRTYQAWSRLLNRHRSRSLRPRKAPPAIDPRWTECFDAFFDAVGPCPDGCRATRPDIKLPYGPGNFVWAPPIGSLRGCQPRLFAFNGELRTLRDWAAHVGVNEITIRARLARHLPFEQAIASVDYRKKA